MIEYLDRLRFSRLTSMQDVRSLKPSAFEYFAKFLMERTGYTNVRVTRKWGRYRADGGVDVTAMREGLCQEAWKRRPTHMK
jgi:restriction endonuclease Mrr